ncbi:D-alanyl-D-alanine endopeptidase [Piscinibacter sp. HJYY11]|uniref:D-alanyl-D-alanine endopeptidase n=1 Tax=Piscinibacter sp. HJYY11 TaxID=2801333 RepID=UPI0028730863|nr:D-alanyl-D-alanine endopeptidase [Piscinibacter sp. HJYY11]
MRFTSRSASSLLRGLIAVVIAAAVPLSAGAAAKPAKKRAVAVSKAPIKSKTVVVRANVKRTSLRHRVVVPARPSFGQIYGLHSAEDPLDLKSSVALVMDQDTNEVLFSKNPQAVLPIASLTKLMTALVVAEARLPMDEVLTISQDDVDTEKGSHSRLKVGTQLTRGEMMHLALMSSENRAAHALGRHYPGGLDAFVAAMNRKAIELGMPATRYVEPTGLSSRNQSSARDLATLVKAAYRYPVIRELSVSPEHQVAVGQRHLQFRNTNGLVRDPEWEIGLQKTGYISEAGRCLVMQAKLAGRQLIMVFLDSAGKYSRIGDAERVRKWVNEHISAAAPTPVRAPALVPSIVPPIAPLLPAAPVVAPAAVVLPEAAEEKAREIMEMPKLTS